MEVNLDVLKSMRVRVKHLHCPLNQYCVVAMKLQGCLSRHEVIQGALRGAFQRITRSSLISDRVGQPGKDVDMQRWSRSQRPSKLSRRGWRCWHCWEFRSKGSKNTGGNSDLHDESDYSKKRLSLNEVSVLQQQMIRIKMMMRKTLVPAARKWERSLDIVSRRGFSRPSASNSPC